MPALKWPNEVVYQIFPDRFHCHDPSARWPSGAFMWHDKPIRVSNSREAVTSREHHQYTFFGGTLEGIRRKLDHLQDLGVTAIYLTPIFKSRSTHRYDTDDYLKVDPMLGSEQDFYALRDDLHARGMKLMLDGVFNHTSWHHRWIKEHPEYYLQSGPNQIETWMGSGKLPKLDVDAPGVTEALLGVIDHWRGVDGWRLDASHLLSRRVLARIKERVGPDRPVIGEDWDDARFDLEEGIYDGVTNFAFKRNVAALMYGDCPPETFARRMRVVYEGYPWPAVVQSWSMLNNHDTERFYSKIGERQALYKLAQVLQFTLPGTPLVYYGDEWGMTGWGDWGARAPMVWRPNPQQQDFFAHLKRLTGLRKQHPVFATGAIRFLHADNRSRTLAYERFDARERALVLLNFGPFEQHVDVNGTGYRLAAHDWEVHLR
ncbi:MAG TPA: glycoside hydrolase family 13 protein [Oscillatoriaceae cyanobacterium]